jgi:hypothetical protein
MNASDERRIKTIARVCFGSVDSVAVMFGTDCLVSAFGNGVTSCSERALRTGPFFAFARMPLTVIDSPFLYVAVFVFGRSTFHVSPSTSRASRVPDFDVMVPAMVMREPMEETFPEVGETVFVIEPTVRDV